MGTYWYLSISTGVCGYLLEPEGAYWCLRVPVQVSQGAYWSLNVLTGTCGWLLVSEGTYGCL